MRRKQKTYRECVDAGICPTCRTKPAENGLVLCGPCREQRLKPHRRSKQRELMQAQKERRIKAGVCVSCPNAVNGFQSCDECRAKAFIARQESKRQIVELYGGECVCCGENQLEFLTLDHIDGGGGRARRSGKDSTNTMRRQILREGRRDDLQLLCMNCNFAKGVMGYCPHQQ